MRRRVPIFWLLPDPHFNHKMLVDKGIRPLDYEEKIFRFIDKNVMDNDVIICLGDLIFGYSGYYASRMTAFKCKKWLIRGNHDKKTATWYMSFGFDSVQDEMKLSMFGKKILFTHKPIVDRNDFDVNIHGHLHGGDHHPECLTNDKCISLFLEGHLTLFNLRAVIDAYNKRRRI